MRTLELGAHQADGRLCIMANLADVSPEGTINQVLAGTSYAAEILTDKPGCYRLRAYPGAWSRFRFAYKKAQRDSNWENADSIFPSYFDEPKQWIDFDTNFPSRGAAFRAYRQCCLKEGFQILRPGKTVKIERA